MYMTNYSAKKSRPVLDGGFWRIGDNPDLGALQGDIQECVDHHVFQTDDGIWHLWGCIRNTALGRVLYHWDAKSLKDEHWRKTGELIRADRSMGESIDDWYRQEWIQSPYVIKEKGLYYMFYGGHSTGIYKKDTPVLPDGIRIVECQMCLMTSKDGREWIRYRNNEGGSRIFTGPGEARDPCIVKIGGIWFLYYSGHELVDGKALPGFYARTSEDLINWSEHKIVHRDISPGFGAGYWDTECPHVVERDGYFYMFRTEDYALGRTHVFSSKDPYDFGIDNADEKYIGMINVAAPEIIKDREGQEYITSNHDLAGGTRICKLKWVYTE